LAVDLFCFSSAHYFAQKEVLLLLLHITGKILKVKFSLQTKVWLIADKDQAQDSRAANFFNKKLNSFLHLNVPNHFIIFNDCVRTYHKIQPLHSISLSNDSFCTEN
jgi:hypothetical protein